MVSPRRSTGHRRPLHRVIANTGFRPRACARTGGEGLRLGQSALRVPLGFSRGDNFLSQQCAGAPVSREDSR